MTKKPYAGSINVHDVDKVSLKTGSFKGTRWLTITFMSDDGLRGPEVTVFPSGSKPIHILEDEEKPWDETIATNLMRRP